MNQIPSPLLRHPKRPSNPKLGRACTVVTRLQINTHYKHEPNIDLSGNRIHYLQLLKQLDKGNCMHVKYVGSSNIVSPIKT